ncbi:MAG: DUF1318 domain-containing protein [Chrysiogenetes bacterium]|nr:DUF1318 domain-containing protein [Chrysiogenetes bacterium]
MKRICLGLAFGSLAYALGGCGGFSLIGTPIFVDDRTALENQVLGEYEPLEEDLLLITSLPGSAGGAAAEQAVLAKSTDPRVSDAQARLVRILQVQQYNQDDLLRYLQQGWIGEKADGYVHLFTERVAEESARTREQLERFVKEANRDRSDLIAALIVISPSLSDSDRPETERLYGKRRIGRLGAGMWYQTPQGTWARVGEKNAENAPAK